MQSTLPATEHLARLAVSVLVVDDRAADRAAVAGTLAGAPQIAAVTAVATAAAALAAVLADPPDVVIVEHRLPDRDGLALARKLKNLTVPPRVLMRCARHDARLAVAALICGADGVVEAGQTAAELRAAVLTLAGGGRLDSALAPEVMRGVSTLLDAADVPILGMLLNGVAPAEIAAILAISRGRLEARRHAILDRLLAPRRSASRHLARRLSPAGVAT